MKNDLKKINRIIPKSMKPMGEKLAEIHCRNQGLDAGTDEYNDEFDHYHYNFNDEAYGLSMTPSGLIGQNPKMGNTAQNPATPKVQANYFEIMDKMFGKKGYVSKHIDNEEHALRFERQIRGSIASLVHFLLDSKYKTQIKEKGKVKSDFEFRKDGGASNNDVVISQYLRLYYTVQVTKALEEVFLGKKIVIENIIDDILGEGATKSPYKNLNPKEIREEFVEVLYSGEKREHDSFEAPVEKTEKVKEIKSQGEYVGKLMQKKENPSKGLPSKKVTAKFYYSQDCNLYFDKNKIDEYVKKNINDCAQIVPKKGYINGITVTMEEIQKADMNEPIVFATIIKNKKEHNFLITGEPQILKALEKGIPSIDCLVLGPMASLKTVIPTADTIDNIEKIKNDLLKSLQG